MRSSIVVALVVSLLAHGLLALALVAYLEYAPGPDVLATLDLSSVELSFAEKVEETAAAMAMPAMPPAKPLKQPKAAEPPAPVPDKALPLPPDPTAPKFREPTEEPRRLEPVRQRSSDEKNAPAPEQSNNPNNPNNRTIEQFLQAPQQARIDAPPRPKRSIRPVYPKGARQRGEQGNVTLEIRVNAKGTVDAASVVSSSGFAELDAAAVRAAKAAKFTPARSGDEAVASVARLTLSFKLRSS